MQSTAKIINIQKSLPQPTRLIPHNIDIQTSIEQLDDFEKLKETWRSEVSLSGQIASEMQQIVLHIKDELENLYRKIDNLEGIARVRSYKPVLLNRDIIRCVSEYIAEGFDETNALIFAAADVEVDLKRTQIIWESHKGRKKSLREYARNYAAIKMREAGFTNKDICNVLKISSAYLQNLDKKNILL